MTRLETMSYERLRALALFTFLVEDGFVGVLSFHRGSSESDYSVQLVKHRKSEGTRKLETEEFTASSSVIKELDGMIFSHIKQAEAGSDLEKAQKTFSSIKEFVAERRAKPNHPLAPK